MLENEDSIVAISSPYGIGGIAVIRSSGTRVLSIIQKFFFKKGKCSFDWGNLVPRHMYYGVIYDKDYMIDEVMLSVFKSPHSYTGEDMVEIYCHGSIYVQQRMLQLFIDNGCRLARPGEFTIRAYLNGKINLVEAEAIGDIIHSETESAHRLAIEQLRGGYIQLIEQLREDIIQFASLLELELDFSEEDIEFANRDKLKNLLLQNIQKISELTESFQLGNALKSGIPVAIIGKPNAGKSTLLNALLNEEKAIVSEIPGTTRDLIEDKLVINGIMFRIIDTAGIREAKDEIEKIGIERAIQSVQKAMIVVIVQDARDSIDDLDKYVELVKKHNPKSYIIKVINKIDLKIDLINQLDKSQDYILISAKNKQNIEKLKNQLFEVVMQKGYKSYQTMVSNVRHYNELLQSKKYLERALDDIINNITTEIIAEDLKFAIQHLSNITGKITSEDVLRNIFSKFCIGK